MRSSALLYQLVPLRTTALKTGWPALPRFVMIWMTPLFASVP